MEESASSVVFLDALILLAAAVLAVPVFKRLGLGAIMGYLVAGLAIGPSGLRFFDEPAQILRIAELGIVLLLFVIGLDLRPSRLWSMRRDIFGLGLAQMGACGLAISSLAFLVGLPVSSAVIVGFGFALSSTAVVLPLVAERGELGSTYGQRTFAILLFQGVAIVPLLALVSLLAPRAEAQGPEGLAGLVAPIATLAAIVLAGRYLLNPMFRLLARAGAREIMVAASLLAVLGAAAAVQMSGLSMAMGAFLAGVLLSESSFRHQLDADIEPFRGLLLGLFFIAVGMGIDVALLADNAALVLFAALSVVAVKVALTYAAARLFGDDHPDSARLASILAPGDEFAFVLFGAAGAAGLLSGSETGILVAAVVLSMGLAPLAAGAGERLALAGGAAAHGPDDFSEARGSVLIIGFSRFGQIAAQLLLADEVEVTAIDHDVELIDAASRFGFKVYYGDGTRLDVLRIAGAERASVIAICVDDPEATLKIVEIANTHFPLAKLYIRAHDRTHALKLLARNVDYQVRDTYESAVLFGRKTLEALGVPPERAADVESDVRRRDSERLALQMSEGIYAGLDILHQRTPRPEPLTIPRREGERIDARAGEEPEANGTSQDTVSRS